MICILIRKWIVINGPYTKVLPVFLLDFLQQWQFLSKDCNSIFQISSQGFTFFTIYNIILIVLPSSISKYSFFKELYKLVKVKKKPEEKANGPLKAKACAK